MTEQEQRPDRPADRFGRIVFGIREAVEAIKEASTSRLDPFGIVAGDVTTAHVEKAAQILIHLQTAKSIAEELQA